MTNRVPGHRRKRRWLLNAYLVALAVVYCGAGTAGIFVGCDLARQQSAKPPSVGADRGSEW